MMTGKIILDEFLETQLSRWPLAEDNFKALAQVGKKRLTVGGLDVVSQYNPARIISSAAATDSKSLSERPCFLCPENRFPEQISLPFRGRSGNEYDILVNPYPIFPDHLVIAMASHTAQTIWQRYPDLLDLSGTYEGYTFFYNGPKCGASAPDHHHFQACGSGQMPLEKDVDAMKPGSALEYVAGEDGAVLYHYRKFAPGIFVIKSRNPESSENLFCRLMDAAPFVDGDVEPRFNLITSYKGGEYSSIIIFRRCHRSHHYFSTGEDHFTMSPGTADMGGVFIVPKPDEFEKINDNYLSEMISEITLSNQEEATIIRKLTHPQQRLCVGVMSARELEFELLSDNAGRQKATCREGKVYYKGALHKELVFEGHKGPEIFSEPSFRLFDVTIGIGFHWERKETQTFAGALRIIVRGDRLLAINEIGVEDYLLSVISSEMKSSSSLEFLKAHAVISRSWVMAQIKHRLSPGKKDKCTTSYCFENGCGEKEIVKWYDHSDHTLYDVCADDHCQRYQGLTRAVGENVRTAVRETWGECLEYDGQICDARFSKCCGGLSETFGTCWEDTSHPYLRALPDTPGHDCSDEAFCNTRDKAILSQVLNDYDVETSDFYEWTVEYEKDELSHLVAQRSGIDIGEIKEIVPLERGGSGRISRLRIIGTKSSFVVGKELEIRKTLSQTHLKSSAFEVEKTPGGFKLHGRGWGHGVGLCQIGAAVMASEGYNYKQILQHYYPDALIK